MDLVHAGIELHRRGQGGDGGATVAELLLQRAADVLAIVDRTVDVAIIVAPEIAGHRGEVRPTEVVIDGQAGNGGLIATGLADERGGLESRQIEAEEILPARIDPLQEHRRRDGERRGRMLFERGAKHRGVHIVDITGGQSAIGIHPVDPTALMIVQRTQAQRRDAVDERQVDHAVALVVHPAALGAADGASAPCRRTCRDPADC